MYLKEYEILLGSENQNWKKSKYEIGSYENK